MQTRRALELAIIAVSAGFYVYLRSKILNARSEIAERNPRCPLDLGVAN
jgi:hypothetical protein